MVYRQDNIQVPIEATNIELLSTDPSAPPAPLSLSTDPSAPQKMKRIVNEKC